MSIVIATSPFTPNLWQDAQDILSYDFMQRALLVSTILSIITGLIGFFVVVRHQAFAGEALSDVAFTGGLGGAVIGINPLIGLIGTTIIVALTMGGLGERLRGRDIAIGTVLAWVLGLGALFFNLFNAYGSRVTGFSGRNLLFADILSIPESQTSIIALISGLVLLALVLIGRPLLFASLDPDVAAAQGVPVRALGLGFMALLAVTVCIATMAVGALLVFALLLLPAATAYQMTTRPSVALALSAGLAIIFSWLGIVISFYTNYPPSVCISLVSFAGYVLVVGGRGRLKKGNAPSHQR